MEHIISLSIPERVYKSLKKIAKQTGQSPEELALEWLAVGLRTYEHDTLDDLVGSIVTDVPDWGTNHDVYLGQAILASMHDQALIDGSEDA